MRHEVRKQVRESLKQGYSALLAAYKESLKKDPDPKMIEGFTNLMHTHVNRARLELETK